MLGNVRIMGKFGVQEVVAVEPYGRKQRNFFWDQTTLAAGFFRTRPEGAPERKAWTWHRLKTSI